VSGGIWPTSAGGRNLRMELAALLALVAVRDAECAALGEEAPQPTLPHVGTSGAVLYHTTGDPDAAARLREERRARRAVNWRRTHSGGCQ
jgi:hypothetical protein